MCFSLPFSVWVRPSTWVEVKGFRCLVVVVCVLGFRVWVVNHSKLLTRRSVCTCVFLCSCGCFYFNYIWVGFLCFGGVSSWTAVTNNSLDDSFVPLACKGSAMWRSRLAFPIYISIVLKINFVRFVRPLIIRVDGLSNMASCLVFFLCRYCLFVTCCYNMMRNCVWIVFYLTNQLINCLTTRCLLLSHFLLQRWLILRN